MKKIIFIMSIAAIATACSNDNDWDATGTFEATEVVVSAKGSGEIGQHSTRLSRHDAA